jgi:hypothetical protein
MNKFEQLIEYVINDDEAKARELFHDIVVEKSRAIYEEMMQEEEIEEGMDEELDEEVEEVEEGMGGDQADDLIDDIEVEEEATTIFISEIDDEMIRKYYPLKGSAIHKALNKTRKQVQDTILCVYVCMNVCMYVCMHYVQTQENKFKTLSYVCMHV